MPTHPGEMLVEEFLDPMDISQSQFAGHLGIPIQRINEIVNGKRGISPDTALLFSSALRTSPEFWINLQTTYDLARARAHVGRFPTAIVGPHRHAARRKVK
jgi:addiction module HigA family antidote